jgi:hypothetical protein
VTEDEEQEDSKADLGSPTTSNLGKPPLGEDQGLILPVL